MEINQTNFHSMMGELKAQFEKHPSVWQAHPLLREPVETLVGLHQQISQLALLQENRGSGSFAAREAALAEAAPHADLLATRLRSYARRQGLLPLLHEMELAPSEFRYGAQDDRVRLVKRVIGAGNAHLAGLAPYGVTAADLQRLQQLLDAAGNHDADASDQRHHATGATARIAALITEARTLLESLDDDVRSFITDTAFIDAYFVARRIFDRRATRRKETPASSN